MKILIIFLLISGYFIFNVIAIVGGRHAAVPPLDDPVVFVNYVGRFARVEGYRDFITGLYTFRGLRYADPPINENRFLRPQYRRLVGDIDATKNSPPCPQPDYYDESNIIGNEDCLALNIFTPQMPDETDGLPVILWIHGGGYRYGSAAQYDAEPLASNQIVFVPIQYRLGTLGILGDGSKEFGGNIAMFDMNAALRWIREYIRFFGGDPKQIKVMGHGSGASSAMHLSASPMGRSSLNGVIAMSGTSTGQYSYETEPVNSVKEISIANNCAPGSNETELIKCLRKKSVTEIIQQDSRVQIQRLMDERMVRAMSGMVAYAPNIEGSDDERSLPGMIVQSPEDSIKNEPEIKMPLLIGVTKDETANGIDPNEIENIFKSAGEFLGAITKTLQINNLLSTTLTGSGNLLGALGIPSLADYLAIPANIDPEILLEKLVEATTDVFFNIPLTLTAQYWGKWAPAFFYQFDHIPDNKMERSGRTLLRPLPLVSKGNRKDTVAHGDELAFLFNINDIYGNPINGTKLLSKSDILTRRNFIECIRNFAYINSTTSSFKLQDKKLSPFNFDGSSFLKISDQIESNNDFRFCQLSVWGAPVKSKASKMSCEFLKNDLGKILPISNQIDNVISGLGGLGFG